MLRRKTRQIRVGKVLIGGDAPISVQSMTNTDTRDAKATLAQIHQLAAAGCEIVRVAVPDMSAAQAFQEIVADSPLPVIADIHFDYTLALEVIANGVHGLRINPGNIGGEDRVKAVVDAAGKRGIPIRIGVNAGSLESRLLDKYGHPTADAMVESALEHIHLLEKHRFHDIKVSLKASNIPMMLEAYQKLSQKVDYPLHVGVTESGTVHSGTIKSSVGIGALLAQGIGDTIRVSLTGDPVHEIEVGFGILKALNLRQRGPELISCPTCGRCQIDLIPIAEEVERQISKLDKPLKVAIMGCVVNGPGEAREADIGIAGGKGVGLLFKKGEIIRKVPQEQLVQALLEELDRMVAQQGDSEV